MSVLYPTKAEITPRVIASDCWKELADIFLASTMSAMACDDYTDGIKNLFTQIGNGIYRERVIENERKQHEQEVDGHEVYGGIGA
jgi:hypothetical protein